MKKLLTSVVAVLLCCGVAIAAEQAAAPATKAACPAKKGVKCTVNGTVESVNAAGMKLVVKTAKGEVKDVVVAADTKIMGKAKTLAEIAAGDTVEVKMVGDKVKSVKVSKPKAKKTEMKKAEVKKPEAKPAEKK
jgi:hypothetical protein